MNVIVIQSGWATIAKLISKAETVEQLCSCVGAYIKNIMSK